MALTQLEYNKILQDVQRDVAAGLYSQTVGLAVLQNASAELNASLGLDADGRQPSAGGGTATGSPQVYPRSPAEIWADSTLSTAQKRTQIEAYYRMTGNDNPAEAAAQFIASKATPPPTPTLPVPPPTTLGVNQGGGLDVPGTPTARPVPVPGAVPGGFEATRFDPLLNLETSPETIFGGYIAPFLGGRPDLSRQFLRNLQGPAEASFFFGLTPQSLADPENTPRYRNFLAEGRPILGPNELFRAIQNQAQTFQGLRGGDPTPFLEKFASGPDVFEQALQGQLAFVNPLFRGVYKRAAEDLFNQWQVRNPLPQAGLLPDHTFLEFLGSRGGRFFQ